MRCYYAIYVYYFTYDITWYAYYGWIWTAIEADLGVMCASAPALKVFFRRYFNQFTNRSGMSGSNGRKTPGYGKGSPGNSNGTSHGTSNLDNTKWEAYPVPLGRINVSTSMGVVVEERDDGASETSNCSTRNLTALPVAAPPSETSSKSEWIGSRTICAAFRPGSKASRKKGNSRDIEREAGRD